MEFFPDSYPLDFLPHWALCFFVALALTALRRRLCPSTYRTMWFVVFAVSIAWGAYAFAVYYKYLIGWRRSFVFLPGLAIFGLCGRLYPTRHRTIYIAFVTIIAAMVCAITVYIYRIDLWSRLLGPYSRYTIKWYEVDHEFFRPVRVDMGTHICWYVLHSFGISILFAVLLTKPRFFGPGGMFPHINAPTAACWRLTHDKAALPQSRTDRWVQQRPLLGVSVFDLLLATAGTAALLVTLRCGYPSVTCYTASFVGGLIGSKYGLAMKCRRLEMALLWGFVIAGVAGLFCALGVGSYLREQPWGIEFDQIDLRSITQLLGRVALPVVARGGVIGIFSASLYLLLQRLNMTLSHRKVVEAVDH